MTEQSIEFLSQPKGVSMADEWYELARPDHFWMARRYRVIRRLVGDSLQHSRMLADIGCGNGMLQQAVSRDFGSRVDGFDLNQYALERNGSGQRRYYYDILERRAEFCGAYDGVFGLDVLEHIDAEVPFLEAMFALAKPGGFICLNVPALQGLYSRYDEKAGHIRRYVIGDFLRLARELGFTIQRWTYWGMPLVPVALLRKWLIKGVPDAQVIERGYNPPSAFANRALGWLSTLEKLPQHVVGTSLMVVLRR